MIKIENDCCDCGLPCIGSRCKNYAVLHFYCDDCEKETELYWFDGDQLCIDCIIERLQLEEVEYDE